MVKRWRNIAASVAVIAGSLGAVGVASEGAAFAAGPQGGCEYVANGTFAWGGQEYGNLGYVTEYPGLWCIEYENPNHQLEWIQWQSDRNLTIGIQNLQTGHVLAVWQSGTNSLFDQVTITAIHFQDGDGNIVMVNAQNQAVWMTGSSHPGQFLYEIGLVDPCQGYGLWAVSGSWGAQGGCAIA